LTPVLNRLVKLSEHLQLDDEQMTPAQAYSAIRESVPSGEKLKSTLEALKVPLAGLVLCSGFGAWLPADTFWRHFDSAMQTLQIARSNLTSAQSLAGE